jgi:hypothetical protein
MCCTLICRHVAVQYWGQILSLWLGEYSLLWHRVVDFIPHSGTKNLANSICQTVVFTWMMNDFPIVVGMLALRDSISAAEILNNARTPINNATSKYLRFFLFYNNYPYSCCCCPVDPSGRVIIPKTSLHAVFYLTTCKGGKVYDLLKGSSSWLEVNSPPPPQGSFFEI